MKMLHYIICTAGVICTYMAVICLTLVSMDTFSVIHMLNTDKSL